MGKRPIIRGPQTGIRAGVQRQTPVSTGWFPLKTRWARATAMSKTPNSAPDPAAQAALERFKAQRVTAIYRLDLIAQGATIAYEDGTPVDMASEKTRLEGVAADMDRRIAPLERAGGGAGPRRP